jgi:hypothetical protein
LEDKRRKEKTLGTQYRKKTPINTLVSLKHNNNNNNNNDNKHMRPKKE